VFAQAALVGVAVLPPVTDLTLSSASYATRAEADSLFTRAQVAQLVRSYSRGVAPDHPPASPLHAGLSGLPPVRIHVGDDEVLLDDSRRYAQTCRCRRVDVRLDVWTGMPHRFARSVGTMKASAQALDAVGALLMERLTLRR
jgi:acetyl esterase/lipase